jgi:hypothetical protein
MNERPWSGTSCKPSVDRFMLYWSTYIPGIFTGWYLIFRGSGPVIIGWVGTVISAGILLWWVYLAARPLDPKELLRDYNPPTVVSQNCKKYPIKTRRSEPVAKPEQAFFVKVGPGGDHDRLGCPRGQNERGDRPGSSAACRVHHPQVLPQDAESLISLC